LVVQQFSVNINQDQGYTQYCSARFLLMILVNILQNKTL